MTSDLPMYVLRLSVTFFAALSCLFSAAGTLHASPCLSVTLTGTQGGPPVFNGQAGAGTLVQYGDAENQCRETLLQFDTGRGTTQSLSELRVPVGKLNAIFLTHMHSDHTEGLSDMMQLRWHFNSAGPKVDLVCADDVESPAGFTLSCRSFARHIGDPLIQSGEIAQRLAENPKRLEGGPADLINVHAFASSEEPTIVWEKGDVTVSAITSRHIPGHASYRVDTPAGSVVIGGDAGNDEPKPPRPSSTSEQVELLAKDVDIIVHSTIHPVMGPDRNSGFPAPIYFRQSSAADLGAMAERVDAAHLMLTHLIPPLGAVNQGPYPIPDGPLTIADYQAAVQGAGYEGNTVVGQDLVTVTIPAQ